MKIIKHKDGPQKLTGSCQRCHCKVETDTNEATLLSDRDGTSYYVHCPECSNEYLWVSDGRPPAPQPLPRSIDC